MDDIFGVFLKNLARFDWIILVLAAVNAIVYCTTRARIERIYYHFNRQDHFTNLCEDAKTSIRAHTRAEQKQLTAGELLSCREAMNKWYALYENLTTMFPLLGMLGTVISLIPMVNAIGSETSGLFFSALTSTFWGIVCALVFKLLDASISYKIDDNEKHMEYLFNPHRKDQQEPRA